MIFLRFTFLLWFLMHQCSIVIGQANTKDEKKWNPVSPLLPTKWTKEASPTNALKEYPRSQMERETWQSLNGLWEYAITQKDVSIPSNFDGQILVPYPIESSLSGVKRMIQPSENLWYRRYFSVPKLKEGEKVLLHFGAVDWQATVFVNNKNAGAHTGGYDQFSLDITRLIKNGTNEIVVKVYDPTDQGPNPHGKQVLNPKDIWYTPTSGIWQTVWLETVPETYVYDLKFTTDIDKASVTLNANISGRFNGYSLGVELFEDGAIISKLRTRIQAQKEQVIIPIRKPHLWSPQDPFLYDVKIKLFDPKGKVVDDLASYFGMRKVEIKKDEKGFDRIFLNNKYVFNLGVLDQGFWPDGIYTAPTDEALAFDIKAIKSMGFNTIRKHIKREPERWYYWCDKLGMMVWQDMVNPSFNLTEEAKKVFETECQETIQELYNHPCITTYTLFNEKWGQYDQERLTKWIKQLDPTRLVNGHSGEYLYVNEKLRSPSPQAYIASDITNVHSYPDPMNSIQMNGKARVLGEFGGIGVFIPDHQWNVNSAWGYINVTPVQLKGKYTIMNQHLKLLEREGLSASIYTQPFDVEGEQNGLMTYDREIVKIPFEDLRKIHSLLVPTEGNLPQVAAQNADLTDPGARYSVLLEKYLKGDRNTSFLRKLAMTAQQVGDKPVIARVTVDYLATLKKPFHIDDLNYVLQITNKTTDAGFLILKENAFAIDKALGERKAETIMMNIIYNEIIAPSVTGQNSIPDWDDLSNKIASYGLVGEEILIRAKTIHYMNQQDWKSFVSAANVYVTKFWNNINSDELNLFAWTAFERVKDSLLLEYAVGWGERLIKSKNEAAYLDTYANLLYKLGRKKQAIQFQERAVLIGDNQTLKITLDKMKRGEKTWN